MKIVMFMVFVISLLPSCMKYKEISFQGVENVRVGKIGMNESTIEMDLTFNNPNNMGATLKSAQGKAWIQDMHVGNFLLNEDVRIPAKSKFSVPVRLSVNLKEVIQNSLTFLFSDSFNIRVEGNASLSKGSFLRNVPLKYQGKKSSQDLLRALQ